MQLLRRRVELQAAAAPLTKRLHRCNAALEDDDKAQALRDRLMDHHERMVGDCLEYGARATIKNALFVHAPLKHFAVAADAPDQPTRITFS